MMVHYLLKFKSVNANLIGTSEILDSFYYEIMYFGPYNEGDLQEQYGATLNAAMT